LCNFTTLLKAFWSFGESDECAKIDGKVLTFCRQFSFLDISETRENAAPRHAMLVTMAVAEAQAVAVATAVCEVNNGKGQSGCRLQLMVL